MRLPSNKNTSDQELGEFDIWITPSLGEITDTKRFAEELDLIAEVFDDLSVATSDFAAIESCEPNAIAATFAELASSRSSDERSRLLLALASTLFLVTGKSDNNFKCQFPLFLRDKAQWTSLPGSGQRRRSRSGTNGIPRVLKSADYMNLVARTDDKDTEEKLLQEIIRFLLIDDRAVRQLWSIGRSYSTLKPYGTERDLLAPIVIFKVRGSVMASGGHEPENLLRDRLREWGLADNADFNLTDVVVGNDDSDGSSKTRAYDFVLPFRTEGWASGWAKRLFIQCQFYAGDSGSVSHKNVDQTNSSRTQIVGIAPDARFLEYVDGAGYFSSLNGDLKKLLAFDTTKSFFQVRSAPIRLRRELQEIGFLTPLEIEHAIAATNGKQHQVAEYLRKDGYPEDEIGRAIQACGDRNIIDKSDSQLALIETRRDMVRRYAVLDTVARCGSSIETEISGLGGRMLVPGYGAFFGLPLDEIVSHASHEFPAFRAEISNSETLLADVRWLCEQKFAMAR